MIIIQVSTKDQIEAVETLAREIWTEYYPRIIGSEQVEYMLDKFQSATAIAGQITAGMVYFLARKNNNYIGYLAVEPRGTQLFLSKIYVTCSMRGKGYGTGMLRLAERVAVERGLRTIALTVNKNNTGAITVYQKAGFKNAGSLVQDIGNGFVMDDYKMEKDVYRTK